MARFSVRKFGNFWPDAMQTLLLRACLSENEESVAAWTQWQDAVDLENIDAGSYNLLPLLAWRLLALQLDQPISPLLRGCLRKAWVASQYSQFTVSAVAKVLDEAGIPVLLLKGVTLDLLDYPVRGVRPMNDVDIAVPQASAEMAREALVRAGWRTDQSFFVATRPHTMAINFKHARYADVDLHFFLFHGSLDASLIDQCWRAARTLMVHQQPCKALGASDQLLHVITHGLRSNPLPPIRWVADAVMILRQGDVDWGRFVSMARLLKYRLVTERGLRYLTDTHGISVPQWVLQELEGPYSWFEKFEYRYERQYGVGQLLVLSTYVRLQSGKSWWRLLLGLPSHFQEYWGKPSLTATALTFAYKLGRLILRKLVKFIRGFKK